MIPQDKLSRDGTGAVAPGEEDEAPLDPAQQRVVNRVRRLVLLSSLLMLVGFAVVFSTIIYRLVNRDTAIEDAGATLSLAMPALSADARLVGTAIDGERILLTFHDPDGFVLLMIDIASGRALRTIRLGREMAPPGDQR